jgi:RNA polymerase sigma factor (sigma-70 family)
MGCAPHATTDEAAVFAANEDRAWRYYRSVRRTYSWVPDDDLMQACRLGLLRAIRRYDPTKSEELGAIAWHRMRAEVTHLAKYEEFLGPVRTPSHTYQRNCPEPFRTRAAEVRRRNRRRVSLDEAGPDGTTVGRAIPDPHAIDPSDSCVNADELDRLRASVDELPELLRDVIAARFGLGGAGLELLREIGERHGVCTAWVSRLEGRAIERLREQMTDEGVGSTG